MHGPAGAAPLRRARWPQDDGGGDDRRLWPDQRDLHHARHHGRGQAEAADPVAKLAEKEAEYAEKFANPYTAAQRGFIDEVIFPQDTRRKLIKAFKMLENKEVVMPNRKHGNIPL